jgi:ATP-dependent exoDNAse (exonuclease V) alpha subunit
MTRFLTKYKANYFRQALDKFQNKLHKVSNYFQNFKIPDKMQSKLLLAQKKSSRQVSNYFQNDKISLLESWQVLKQIIDKISNWIPDKMQSRLLSAPKEDPDKFQNYRFYFSKIPSYCSSYQDYCSNYCSSYCSTDRRHCSSASSFFVVYFTVSSSI